MEDPGITGVPDTAFMVAAWRASESERRDALFRDPFAALLAGARGRMLGDRLSANRMGNWQLAIRTVLIDRMLRSLVDAGATTVLNLGAGLDARPYRLPWPASLRWIEVDFPELLDWKAARLAHAVPTCRLERVKLDLTDVAARRRLFAEIRSTSPATLVLTEGVVPYLTNQDVGALADDLHALPSARWIVDYFSPESVRYRKRSAVAREMRAAPFRFEPPDWFGFFRDHGWRPLDIQYLAIEGKRLGRPAPLPALIRAMLRVQRALARTSARGFDKFSGYVVLGPLPDRPSEEQV